MPSQHGNLEQKYTWKTHLGLVTSIGGTRFTNSRNHFMGSNNLHQQENSRVPLEVSCLGFFSTVEWNRLNLSHPNEKKKKIETGYFPLPFSSFLSPFFSFPPLICSLLLHSRLCSSSSSYSLTLISCSHLHSSSIVGRVVVPHPILSPISRFPPT